MLVNKEISYKCLLNERNNSIVSKFSNWVRIGIFGLLEGLKKVVKDKFICKLIILLVNWIVVKVNCIVKLIVMLINICWLVIYKVLLEIKGIFIGGRDGVIRKVINIVRLIFIL